jgi:hypothetical protein
LYQREHDRSTFAAAIRSGEQQCLAPESNSAQCPLGGVVAHADPTVVQEQPILADTLEHVVHGFGDVATSLWRESLARSRDTAE